MKILFLICALLLNGCIQRIESSDYKNAIELCKNNDGVDHISIGVFEYAVHCKNKAVFNGIQKNEH